MKMRHLLTTGMILVLLGINTRQLNSFPYAVFIVHCEPKNANAPSFLHLQDMVVKADQHQVS